jgi:hypothetical protein
VWSAACLAHSPFRCELERYNSVRMWTSHSILSSAPKEKQRSLPAVKANRSLLYPWASEATCGRGCTRLEAPKVRVWFARWNIMH